MDQDAMSTKIIVMVKACHSSLPALTIPLVGPAGEKKIATAVCTSLACLQTSRKDDSSLVIVFTGHMDGIVAASSFTQKRQLFAWRAHSNCQVVGLAVHLWTSVSTSPCVISQGRDGYIRFWRVDVALGRATCAHELPCCEFTFCAFNVWRVNPSPEATLSFLAFVTTESSESPDLTIEAIRSEDNLTVASIDAALISKLGMCMALSGLPEDPGPLGSPSSPRCLFLAAFEAGCVLLFCEGKPLLRVSPESSAECRPITCLALSPDLVSPDGEALRLVAVGRTAMEVDSSRTQKHAAHDLELLQLRRADANEYTLIRPSKSFRSLPPSSHGVSALAWRDDGKLLAVALWNGDVRLLATSPTRLRFLGTLVSPGAVLGGGCLLGEWASLSSTAVTPVPTEVADASSADDANKSQPKDTDQLTLSVRACLFMPSPLHWLLTTSPAAAGGAGAFNAWDVYRT
ncbi:hypothetical protein SprV_0602217500 [Sparganum proliferum]